MCNKLSATWAIMVLELPSVNISCTGVNIQISTIMLPLAEKALRCYVLSTNN